ncbi:hypothetical protein [uncultured Cohaesibacter sp.]|uniref:hypothetical protein n=1 Tax=uncultured Cohaesibacter sp. TaxID=1002546 RepID=UPI0029C8759E|nr:hypothetical protein [uncultured Cohaesibacter sp.]
MKTLPVSDEERQLEQRLLTLSKTMPNRQCVALAKAAVSDTRTVREWRKGQSVLERHWPAGTPIATFLNREGEDSHLYDGGVGVGIPGNMTSHAAVLIGYVEASGDDPDGILVFDQHGLLDGFRRMIYPVDHSLFGTSNAANYYVIVDEDNLPIGGQSNPCWQHVVSSDKADGVFVL